ncbi:hypothetical protein [Dactylosporangium salmoneum]|uniref:DUF397 domain-containing protein n=1 Tax=Dactylosporangium salmoneum TaxID=53361 RepID=A0ABN3G9M2_9ACTN
MSKVLEDPRVAERPGGGYTIRQPSGAVDVLEVGTSSWAVFDGEAPQLIPVGGTRLAINFASAEAAVAAVLGAAA